MLPLIFGALLGLACSPQAASPLDPEKAQKTSSLAPDGDLTVNASQLVNTYAQLTAAAAAGAMSVTVDLTALATMGLQPGDLLMIMQMQGAQIDTSDPTTGTNYGKITSLNGAGSYELISVKGVNLVTGVVTLDGLCGGLKNSYSAAGHSQIVRVPQYNNVTVNSGAQINGQAWNGNTGGVLALRASHVTVLSGASINASTIGFRKGTAVNAGNPANDISLFASANNNDGGGKGEGIAGVPASSFARGAVANGGGGGNSFGAGGGGGSNGGDPTMWQGAGVMNLHFTNDQTAWGLDPEAQLARTNQTGGGRGGYTQATSNEDATKVGPGNLNWGGNDRRNYGGRGGSPVPNNPALQLFLGGGGGAGAPTADAGTVGRPGSDGGAGGGLIYLLADKVDGSGLIVANGDLGLNSVDANTNGAGGGGGGGTIVINSGVLTGNLTLQAVGGGGGNQLAQNAPITGEAEGPGGGGGGGFIAVPSGTPNTITQSAAAGTGGITQSDLLTEFPSNGATDGHAGFTGQSLNPQGAQTPICAPVDLRVSVENGLVSAPQGARINFIITVYNNGPFTATAAPFTGTASPVQANVDWTCTATSPQQDVAPASCASAEGTGDVNTTLTLPAGASATILVRVPVTAANTTNLQYTATATAPSGVNDLNPSDNTATSNTQVSASADLQMRATVAPSPVQSNYPVTFILSVSNAGPNTASNVVVTFDIPAMSTVAGSPVGSGWTCSLNQGQTLMTCTLPTLAVGPAPDITIPIQPNFGDAFALGSAHVSSDASDPDLSNNSATAVVDINYNPAGYMQPVLAGGGFGCSQAGTGTPSSLPALYVLAMLGLLLSRRRVRSGEH